MEDTNSKQNGGTAPENCIRISFRFGSMMDEDYYPFELSLYSCAVPRIGETVIFGDSIPESCFLDPKDETVFYEEQVHLNEWIVKEVVWEMGAHYAWKDKYGNREEWAEMRNLAHITLISRRDYAKATQKKVAPNP